MALPINTIPLSATDFCGKQVMAFREAFWTSTFQNPAINELLTVVPGVKAKQQVVILGLINMASKTIQTTNCAPDPSDQIVPDVQKFYDPESFEDRFVECWKNLLDKFYVWGLKNGIDKPNLTDTDFADFLIERVSDALYQSLYRIIWFAERNAARIADGGHFGPTFDLRYVNGINGLWQQFFAIGAANPSQVVNIAKNAGATFAAQKFTAADTTNQVITGVMQTIIDSMDERLAGDDPKFYVTRSVWNQLQAERRAFPYINLAYDRTEAGFDRMDFGGYEVVLLKFEDRMIKQFQSSATVSYLPHRIYFTTKENLHLATEESNVEGMTRVEEWYDAKSKEYGIDTLFTLDALVIEDYKVMLAY